ncbi:Rieske 2Fe-2S domain-containing protein [Egicoccus halophilus]|uniref:Ring-hydroxylating oxygenase subunit alpha n=1 Tax=Egicoccus halophilus TaxID=1670830 RepID=A0A8J3A4Q2_9ACTN|nr:Rieske 2Fe-2S domain-containing protein [Egicoccus halophilus]GGI02407.1 ring-hydroxylating oxygenase subunit alpha [Egicoccus halophilus]
MLRQEQNEVLSGTGPGTPMGEVFRRFWIPALLSEELPAPDCAPVRVRLLGEDLVAFRDSTGKVGLVDEACPHRGASLFFGRNEDCGLRCTYHGWKFDRDGQCVDMPNEPPDTQFKEKVTIKAYPTVEQGGAVWTYMGPEEHEPQMPAMEWSLVPEEHRFLAKIEVDCNYAQAMEGDIDSSHTAFLHGRVGEDSVDRGSANKTRKERLRRFSFIDRAPKFFLIDTDYGFMAAARRYGGDEHYYWRITQWLFPAFSITPREAGSVLQCNMRIPIDDHRHMFYRTQYRPQKPLTDEEVYEYRHGGNLFQQTVPGTYRPVQTLENDFLIDRSLQRSGTYSGIKGIPAQDQSVTVSMGPIVERSKERLATSDAAIIHSRRLLLKQAQEVQKNGQLSVPGGGDPYFVRGVGLLVDRDTPFDVGAAEAMDANNPWHEDVAWAQVEPVGVDHAG